MGVGRVEQLLLEYSPPLLPDQAAELKGALVEAMATHFDETEEKDLVRRVRKALQADRSVKDVGRRGTTASVQALADFLEKQKKDFSQWVTLQKFDELNDDPVVSQLLIQHSERSAAFEKISSSVAFALRKTGDSIKSVRNLLHELSRRNIEAKRLVTLASRGKNPMDQEVRSQEDEVKSLQLRVQSGKDALQEVLEKTFSAWREVKELLRQEEREWKKLKGGAKKAATFYGRCTMAVNTGEVALGVLGAGVIVGCLVGATVATSGAAALVLAISAELLGIASWGILSSSHERARAAAQHYEELKEQCKREKQAAQTQAVRFKDLYDYASALNYELSEEQEAPIQEEDIWKHRINASGFTYAWLMKNDNLDLSTISEKLQNSVEDLVVLLSAAAELQHNLQNLDAAVTVAEPRR